MAFTTETLQGLGLSDEQVKGVMAEHGKDVNDLKEQNSTLTSERDSFKSQVDEVTKNLSEANKNAEKGSEAQQQVEALQKQLKESESQAQEQLQTQRKSFEIDKALTLAGSKNNKATLALIDTDKISIDDNGNLIGLNDQVKTLADSEDTSFMFGTDTKQPPKPVITPVGNPTGGQGSGNDTKSTGSIEDRLSAKVAENLAKNGGN